MPKLKPKWVKTDIPTDTKVKLWRIMKDNPTYRSWVEAIVGKSYTSAQDELFVNDELKYIKMSRDTYKALKYEIMHMPVEEVENLPPDLRSWVRQLRPELELERYPRREAEDYSAITNVDAIFLTPELERRHKAYILYKWFSLDVEEIAEKLGILSESVWHNIEEAEKELTNELTSKTKEESKMEQSQSMANLPPWVNQAQWEHLERREQRGDLVGMEIITYPGGIGIREQLELFKNSFSDINPRYQSFWFPKDEIVMAQLHGHLPDKAFWKLIEGSEGFIKKAKECEALLDAAREKFASAGEELAPLQQVITGPVPDVYITSGWVRRVLVRALSRELGFSEPSKYHISEIKEGDFFLEDEEVIYRGPDAVAAEQRHRELVEGFIESEEFPPVVNLMKDLRNLVQRIFARIDQCLRGREYSYNYCPDCPAGQARKMLASKEE